MADDINNPSDSADLKAILRAQREGKAAIDAVSRGIDELVAEKQADARKTTRRSSAEGRTVKEAATRGAKVPEPTPVEREAAAKGADRETAASRRAAKAKLEEARANKELAASEARLSAQRRAPYTVTKRPGQGFGVVDARQFEIARVQQRAQAEKLAADLDKLERRRARPAPTFRRPSLTRQAALYAEAMGLTAEQVVQRSRTGIDVAGKPYVPPQLDAGRIAQHPSYRAPDVVAASRANAEALAAEAREWDRLAAAEKREADAARKATQAKLAQAKAASEAALQRRLLPPGPPPPPPPPPAPPGGPAGQRQIGPGREQLALEAGRRQLALEAGRQQRLLEQRTAGGDPNFTRRPSGDPFVQSRAAEITQQRQLLRQNPLAAFSRPGLSEQYNQPPPGARGPGLSAEQEELLARAERNVAAASREEALALQRTARVVGLSGDEFRRHGALTTEFITAAARGETTFRELGFQASATIGKFAGWTAAASAVYGAAAAVQALGRGALDSASGVGLISRVVSEQQLQLAGGAGGLQKGLRGLSAKFNLPISDVTQAVYGSAKVFGGDLPAALKASESALFAVKVGELSAAEATTALTGIVQGFKLSADELPGVFDTINTAQNKFAVNSGQLAKGVGRAAGVFRNAGGDYRELITLLTAGSRLTGQPAETVATAIQRAVSTAQTPQGAARLRAVGLDPTQEFTQIFAEAQRKAQGSTPDQVNQIARALVPAGGQFVKIFTPLLQNQQLTDQIFAQLSPDKVRGSGQRELDKALGQANEQLKAIVNNLERLGSSLAQAGGLGLLGALVKSLNTALSLSNRLLDVFNTLGDQLQRIPLVGGPIHAALLPLLEVAGIVRVLRRLDFGSSLPAGRQGSGYSAFRERLRRDPEQRFGAQVTQGVRDERNVLQEERRAAANAARRAAVAAADASAASAVAATSFRAEPTPENEQRLGRAVSRHEAAALQAERLEAEQLAATERINSLKTRELEYERLRASGIQSRIAAEQAGVFYANPSLDRPFAAQPVRTGIVRPGPIQGGTGFGGAVPPGARAGAYGVVPGTGGVVLRGLDRSQRDAARQAAAQTQAARRLGISGGVLGSAAGAGSLALRGAGAGIRSAGAGIVRLARSLGPLDKAIIGLVAGYALLQSASRAGQRAADAHQAITASGLEPDRLRVLAREAREQAAGPLDKPSANPLAVFHDFGATLHDLPHDLTLGLFGSGSRQTARDDARRADAEARRVDIARAQGKELKLPAIEANLKRRLAAARNDAEIDDALNSARVELAQGYARTYGGPVANNAADLFLAGIAGRKAAIQAGLGNLDAAAKLVSDLPTLKSYSAAVDLSFAQKGPTKSNFQARGIGIARGRELASADPQNAAALIAQANADQQALQQDAQAVLDRTLSAPHSVAQGRRARSTFLTRIRGATSQAKKDVLALGRRIHDTQADIASARAAVDQAEAGAPFALGGQATLKARRSRLAALRRKLAELRAQRHAVDGVVARLSAEAAAEAAAVNQAAIDNSNALFDARTAAIVAGISDPHAAAAKTAQRASQNLGRILKQNKGRKDNVPYQNALAQQRAAAQALNDQQATEDPFAQQLELRRSAANIGASEAAKLQGAASDARALVAHLKSTGAKSSDITAAIIASNNAQGALADYARSQAQELLSATAELAKSRTDDPVKQAQIDAKLAVDQQRFATTLAERRSARANVNNARKTVRDARLTKREDTIDFNLEMERITKDEAESQYRSLLKTKGLTTQARRDILRKIKGLNDGSEDQLDINVGDIKLPTLYEVRRAVIAGAQGAPAISGRQAAQLRTANNNYGGNTVHITVNDPAAASHVYEALDRYGMGPGKAADRAAGRR